MVSHALCQHRELRHAVIVPTAVAVELGNKHARYMMLLIGLVH